MDSNKISDVKHGQKTHSGHRETNYLFYELISVDIGLAFFHKFNKVAMISLRRIKGVKSLTPSKKL